MPRLLLLLRLSLRLGSSPAGAVMRRSWLGCPLGNIRVYHAKAEDALISSNSSIGNQM